MTETNSQPRTPPPATSYWDYIHVEQLLALQGGIEGDEAQLSDDEVRFIVIHQIDELWMKLTLRELTTARDLFKQNFVPETSLAAACAALRRVGTLFDLSAQHFRLMETMRTQDYLRFRDKLFPASGFQSAQLREIEILFGLDEDERIAFGNEASYRDALRGPGGASTPALERVERRERDRPTLKDAIYAWLARTPINASSPGSPDDEAVVTEWIEGFLARMAQDREQWVLSRIATQALTEEDNARLRGRYEAEMASARAYLCAEDRPADERAHTRRLRAAILFIESNRDLPLLSWPGEIIDGLVAAEQSLLIFRQRHARMVERVIGRRVGTGGSAGVDYLDETALRYRVFKEIWAARTMLMEPERTPPVQNPDYYGLRSSEQ